MLHTQQHQHHFTRGKISGKQNPSSQLMSAYIWTTVQIRMVRERQRCKERNFMYSFVTNWRKTPTKPIITHHPLIHHAVVRGGAVGSSTAFLTAGRDCWLSNRAQRTRRALLLFLVATATATVTANDDETAENIIHRQQSRQRDGLSEVRSAFGLWFVLSFPHSFTHSSLHFLTRQLQYPSHCVTGTVIFDFLTRFQLPVQLQMFSLFT